MSMFQEVRRTVVAAAAALLACGFAAQAHAAAEVQFSPSALSLMPGEVIQVWLRGADFTTTPLGGTINNVTGGQNLRFTYNPAVFEVLSAAIAPRWNFGPGNQPGTINAVAGTMTGMAFGNFPATTDTAFDIASFTLRALQPGAGSLTLVSGQFIGQVNGSAAQLINPALGSLTVSVVPEPGQWLLLMAGLAGIVLRLQRR